MKPKPDPAEALADKLLYGAETIGGNTALVGFFSWDRPRLLEAIRTFFPPQGCVGCAAEKAQKPKRNRR